MPCTDCGKSKTTTTEGTMAKRTAKNDGVKLTPVRAIRERVRAEIDAARAAESGDTNDVVVENNVTDGATGDLVAARSKRARR